MRALPAQGSGARGLFRVRQIQGLAVLAAIDFRILAELALHFVAEKVPALEVAGAELSLLVFFIAGPHPRDPALDLGSVAERRDQFGHGDRFVTDGVFGIGHTGYLRRYHDPLQLLPQRSRVFCALQVRFHLGPDPLVVLCRDPGHPLLFRLEADHQAVGARRSRLQQRHGNESRLPGDDGPKDLVERVHQIVLPGRIHFQVDMQLNRVLGHGLQFYYNLGSCMKTWIAFALAWPCVAATVEFNRDIRPIFSDKCYTCHGPDKTKRSSKLRLDTEAGARIDLGGHFAIVAGDPVKSELVRRITADNKALRMPPVYSGATLSSREIELIREWIAQGAVWEKHWSFIPPRRREPPQVSKPDWVRNPIDALILARLDREGLAPSPEADRAIQIRRVTLDLTGIPPTLAEVDAFVRDGDYEKAVDRLLQSPRYGERMAARWLDAARYADTNGYQTDGERSMWRWRDWVIAAFNRNMPFDQFTVEQIAGDMLPNATLDQKIASGFNRNHRGNGEGGIVPEEYAVEYVVDRVDTTSTVWLGLTVGCARCHDHKYDPILQKEFYQFFAYFNQVPERGMSFKYGNSPPFIQAPTTVKKEKLREIERKYDEADVNLAQLEV